MKHATSRFFRFFLVAALVAAMVGSLLPAKVAGQTAASITVASSNTKAGGVTELTISLTPTGFTANVSKVNLKFSHAQVPSTIGRTDIIVSATGGGGATLLAVAPTVSGSTVSFFTPIAAPERIVISSSAGIRNSNAPTAAAKVTVNGTDSEAYSVTQFLDISPSSQSRSGTVTVTGGGFSAGTSGGSISLYNDGIRGVSDYVMALVVDPNDATKMIPSLTGTAPDQTVDLFSATTVRPVTLPADDDDAVDGIQLSAEDVLKGIIVRPYPAGDPCDEDAAVSTIGSGSDQNTRPCNDDDDVAPRTVGTGGTYSVDSSGALSGSFVASSGTAIGGLVQVTDLGSGATISSSAYSQKASVTPTSTEVSLGSELAITLTDFAEGSTFTATIAGEEDEGFQDSVNDAGTKASLTIAQDEGTGTKRVSITGTRMVSSNKQDDANTPQDEAADVTVTQSASFLITIVSRSLTLNPSSTVPGQAVTVKGEGFSGIQRVDLSLADASIATNIVVNTDGTFLYTGKVPFNDDTVSSGGKTWRAVDSSDENGRAATSSGFTIQKRSITLSPSTSNPGSTVEVYGAGFGVTTRGTVNSQVTLNLEDSAGVPVSSAVFGPFPVSSSGEFTGAIQVPTSVGVSSITVKATDNNGGGDNPDTDQTGGFADNQTATASLRVPTGVISVSPDSASTGTVITVTGNGFPAQTNLAELFFGDANALPVPAPATDVNGNFTVTLTVPAAPRGGSLAPGAVVIKAKVASIEGTTSFTIPGPSITLSVSEARPGETISLSGTGFSAYSNVGTINVGQQNQAPTPNPLTDGIGDFDAEILIPALNPGAYTITVRTSPAFTATAPIRILSSTVGNVVPAETAFQALTSRGILTLAAAAPPGGTMFGAYVPGLAGNTLVNVEPNGVLILTLNADARIAVSGQPAVDVAANTPTFFALGSVVSIEVVG
jgi:hypothetical protein